MVTNYYLSKKCFDSICLNVRLKSKICAVAKETVINM